MEVGTSEAEPIWTEFLRKLTRRGLRGVKLVTPVPTALSWLVSATRPTGQHR